ncbi:TRAP transporter large permease [Desulfosporosinus fructosivorans]|uniref:TRAP transporter large permease n=1 Tax=Desulfosporosinus fructosivorans TaxID=2018669 RepID=A0A4Z0RAA6_9FIRM|nr:TRAP transporter large permease [Desulfosporosinus fructosivorans]TGE39259.1 TRAP transporter large permease [Desulfosporosinus fructosivorans]
MSSLLIFIGLLLVLLVLRVPIFISLAMSAMGLGVIKFDDPYLAFVVQKMFSGADNLTLMAIPLFMLTGDLMNNGGMSKRLIDFSNCCVGWIRGGLGFVTVMTCCFLAAILGSSSACAAIVAAILIPAMVKRGYDLEFAGALTAASGGIGPIIPPSATALIYAVAASQSVKELFIAGYVPGVMIAAGFMLYTYYVARKKGYPAEPKPTVKSFFTALKSAIIPLMLPIIIMGGIVSGIFTATESAVVAVLYCVFVSVFLYKEIKVKDLPKSLMNSAKMSCIVLAVMTTANFLGYIMTLSQIPQATTAAITSFTESPIVFLLMINVILIFAGMFLDAACAIVILVPVLLPAALALGVDPVFFGVMMTVNLMIGVLTPPVGLNLYVVSSISDINILRLSKAVLPFIFIMIVVLLIMVFFPQTVTFLL